MQSSNLGWDSHCKVFPLRASAGPWGSGKVKAPDFLDFRRCEGGKVVTLTHRPSLPPGVSWYSFSEAKSTSRHVVPPVDSEKIPSDTTGDRGTTTVPFLSWLCSVPPGKCLSRNLQSFIQFIIYYSFNHRRRCTDSVAK